MIISVQRKIYHILHVDRLQSIIKDGHLWCDAKINQGNFIGTNIGMNHIKQRRLTLSLSSYPDLQVGDCVPFYYCPRSIMLYLIHRGNHPNMTYRGDQSFIIHLEADLHESIAWANKNNKRWVFTLSNAGSSYFEDRNNINQLNEINWAAVDTTWWGGEGISSDVQERKQAEFLMENSFPWHLVQRIGVHSEPILQQVLGLLKANASQPRVEVIPAWYY